MDDRFTIRRLRLDDLEELRHFHRECFGRELDLGRWRWFNLECPDGPVRAYLAQDSGSGKIAGTYSLLPLRLRLNGSEVHASLAVNAAVHPDFRKQGLFVRLGQHALDREQDFDSPITIGKPNQSALAGHRRLHWVELCPLPVLFKSVPKPREHHCRKFDRFDDRFDTFFESIAPRYSFLALKNFRWMNWRFNPPDRRYTTFAIERAGGFAGCVVLKKYSGPKGPVTHILELLAEEDDALAELVAAAESFAAGTQEINLWTNPHDPHAAALKLLGFSERPGTDRLILHTNYNGLALPEPDSWRFSYADNDIH